MADSVQIRLGADVSSAIAGLQSFGNAAKISIGAAVASLAALTKSAIDAADSIGKAAQKAGQSVESFSQMVFVGRLADASVEDLQKGFKELSKNVVENNKAFDELGIARLTKDGTFRDASEVLLDISDKFQGMRDGVNKVTYATQLFGKAGQQLIPLLNQGRDAIKGQMEEARQLGVVIDEKLSQQSQDFNDNLTRIGQGIKGIGFDIARSVLPALKDLSEELVKLAKWSHESGFAKTLGDIAKAPYVLGKAGSQAIAAVFGGKTYEELMAELYRIKDEAIDMYSELNGSGKSKGPPEESIRYLSKELQLRHELYQIEELRSDGAEDFGITQAQRNERETNFLEVKYEKLQQIRKELESGVIPPGSISDPNAKPGDPISEEAEAYNRKLLPVLREIYQTQQKIADVKSRQSFMGNLKNDLRGLADQIGTFSQASARFVTDGIGAAFNGLSEGIYGAVTGTKSWGQAWQEVGAQVLRMFINLIVQAVELFAILTLLDVIFPGFGHLLAASAGAGSAIGGAVAAGSRATGGPVTHGLYQLGEQGPEYVINAPTLAKYGQGYFDAMQAGKNPSTPSTVSQSNVNIAVLHDGAAIHDWLQSSDGERAVVDIMGRNIHRFRS